MAKLKLPRSAVPTQLQKKKQDDPFFYIGLQRYELIGKLEGQGNLWLIIRVDQKGKRMQGVKPEKRSETEILVDIALYQNYVDCVKRTGAAFITQRKRKIT
jgi:hypothetical protein